MLFSYKILLFGLIFSSFILSSFEDEKAKQAWLTNLNNNFLKIEQKFEVIDKRLEELERKSSKGSNALDAVHEILTNLTRAISISNEDLAKKIENVEKEVKANSERGFNFNICDSSPCTYGRRCQPRSTGVQYECVDCPNFRSGKQCENIECIVKKTCWRLNGTLYTVFETKLNWTEAKAKCENEGMTLAMPKDQERTEFLFTRLKPIYSNQHLLWLGLRRGASGWFWVDGSRLGSYTGTNQRMNYENGTLFGQLWLTGPNYTMHSSVMWTWAYADNQHYALCETLLLH